MGSSGDAAEQVVRMSLEGVETIAKITGKGAENLAKLLIAEMKKPQRTKGRASLMSMLKQKKPIKVFEIDDKSLRTFCQEAKKYGVSAGRYSTMKTIAAANGNSDISTLSENDIEEAIECMKRAILYDLNNSEYYDRMSDLYKEKEDYKTALEYMSEAANIDNSEEYKQKYAQLVKLNRKSK